jgi:hypothetical protein
MAGESAVDRHALTPCPKDRLSPSSLETTAHFITSLVCTTTRLLRGPVPLLTTSMIGEGPRRSPGRGR